MLNKIKKNSLFSYALPIMSLEAQQNSCVGKVCLFGKQICQQDPCQLKDAIPAIGAFIKYLAGLAVVISIIAVAFAGLKMVASAGNSGEVSKARDIMTNALWGVFIALAAYLIIQAIVTGLGGVMTNQT